MKRWRIMLLTGLFVVAGCALVSAAAEPIYLGLSAPMTEKYAEYGDSFEKGLDLGIGWINDAGGLQGRPVELIIGDSQGDANVAKRVARKFAEDPRIVAVIGDFASSCSMAAQPYYHRAGLVQISPTSSHPSFAAGSPFSFSLPGTDELLSTFMARAVVEKLQVAMNRFFGNRNAQQRALPLAFRAGKHQSADATVGCGIEARAHQCFNVFFLRNYLREHAERRIIHGGAQRGVVGGQRFRQSRPLFGVRAAGRQNVGGGERDEVFVFFQADGFDAGCGKIERQQMGQSPALLFAGCGFRLEIHFVKILPVSLSCLIPNPASTADD
jgi:hypothetical protein